MREQLPFMRYVQGIWKDETDWAQNGTSAWSRWLDKPDPLVDWDTVKRLFDWAHDMAEQPSPEEEKAWEPKPIEELYGGR